MYYTVEFDFGSGWVNHTTFPDGSPKLEGRNPVRRFRQIHKNLKPVISTCSFKLIRDINLINSFLGATSSVKVRVKKSGAAYFLGTVRPTEKNEVGTMSVRGMDIECVGAWYRLEKQIDFTATWANYKVSDPNHKATSVLHQLFYAAGFSDSELNLSAIDIAIDRISFDAMSGKTYRQYAEKLLEETGFSIMDSPAGVLETYNLGPGSITSGGNLTTGAGGNIASGYETVHDEAAYEAVDVSYYPHKTLAGETVFEDMTGATSASRCSILIGAGGYYPEGATASVAIDAQYKIGDYEIVAVDSATLSETHIGALTKQVATGKAKSMSMRLYSSSGVVITSLKVTGNAIVKGDLSRSSVENLAGTAKREGITCEWVQLKADADRLANLRATWHKYAAYIHTLPNITDLTLKPGDYRTLVDSAIMSNSQLVRVLSVSDGPDPKSIKVVVEGCAAYESKTVVFSGMKQRSSEVSGAIQDAAAATLAATRIESSASMVFQIADGSFQPASITFAAKKTDGSLYAGYWKIYRGPANVETNLVYSSTSPESSVSTSSLQLASATLPASSTMPGGLGDVHAVLYSAADFADAHRLNIFDVGTQNDTEGFSKSYSAAASYLAKIEAQAYADGIVSAEEARAIADAQAKADAALVAANAAVAALVPRFRGSFLFVSTSTVYYSGAIDNDWIVLYSSTAAACGIYSWTGSIWLRLSSPSPEYVSSCGLAVLAAVEAGYNTSSDYIPGATSIEVLLANRIWAKEITLFALGWLKSHDYAETDGYPTAGFMLDVANQMIKAFAARFANCSISGSLITGAEFSGGNFRITHTAIIIWSGSSESSPAVNDTKVILSTGSLQHYRCYTANTWTLESFLDKDRGKIREGVFTRRFSPTGISWEDAYIPANASYEMTEVHIAGGYGEAYACLIKCILYAGVIVRTDILWDNGNSASAALFIQYYGGKWQMKRATSTQNVRASFLVIVDAVNRSTNF